MRRALVAKLSIGVLIVLSAAACGSPEPAATAVPEDPPFQFFSEALDGAVLTLAEAGEKWTVEEDATPSTVLIGGVIGPANIDVATEEATTAFTEKEASGYLSDTLLLMENEAIARAVMAKHDEGDGKQRWSQERNNGGKAVYRRIGRITDLPAFGDEMYTASLKVKITDAAGTSVDRKVEYVVFRVRNLLAFVVTQDAKSSVYARRLESNIANLIG